MKRTGVTRRVLAMLLVIVMTLQILPVGVFAFGELRAVDTEIDVSTLNKEDAINWPIKIYDYVSDGMLFEWNDSTHTSALGTGHANGENYTAPYGGGEAPPVTALGSDFTYAASTNYSSSSYNSPYYYASSGTMYHYTLTKNAAVDYQTPYYLRISDNTSYGTSSSTVNHNMLLNYFVEDESTSGDIRYMVMAYRANKVEDYYFSISLSDSTAGTALWDRNQVTLPDSSDWTYVVYDLSTLCSSSIVQWIWLTFGTSASTYSGYKGMVSGAYLDLTHVGYFSDLAEAHNYGQACVKFDKNPGEYLRQSTSFTATTTTVSPSARLDYIFSLYWNWKVANDAPEMGDANSTNVYYGMDFTTTSKENGAYTNAYTTNTYWTWETGATQYYKYTQNGVTGTNTFVMDAISVEQKSEGNGAMYVRLTNEGPSRILLSKFREDLAGTTETWIPLTSEANYAVLVYRPNGLEAADQYAFWAQGYDTTSANSDYTSASNWKYAGLVSDTSTWTSASNVNPQSFGTESGWQYVVVPLTETIGAKDSDMSQVTRLARTGLYLPELSEGKSLDLAYAVYFNSQSAADTFGAAAVDYMNSDAVVSETTTSKSWGTSRVWNAGNNKGFGMLRATGGGNWATVYHGGDNTTDDYGYFTWMLGYDTSSSWNAGGNVTGYRRDPITGEAYTAQYTSTSSTTIDQSASGTTNNIYFINTYGSSDDGNTENGDAFDTSVLDFDGYDLLETIKAEGVLTVGLLEGSLRTVNVDGTEYRVPVYRQETVEYIAYLLVNALRIPQRDTSGNYNMNYVAGVESTQFGGVDLNGDGSVGYIDLDGDPRNGNETNEASVDLATALRYELGITLSLSSNVGLLRNSYDDTLGTYAETLKKSDLLIGEFSECRNSIETAMDAAYYMLNSLFVASSFNQPQDDYYYLQMPSATVEMDGRSGTAYVFDAGFTTGVTAEDGSTITDDGTNKSAISYSPVVDANNQAGTGTIYMNNVSGKTQFNFSASGTAWTTRFPFLPVTDAEGDYAGGTYSYSFWDDDQREYHTESNSYYQPNADASNYTANRRNYNYVIASNGEFVYNKSDALFFDFEGDDDVYLFINGELVMDNGAAHSITGVTIDVNDYVDKAREVMAELYDYGYTNDMAIEEFDEMISGATLEKYIYDESGRITGTETVTNPYTADQIANFKRWCRLDLVDGQICKFDFYYMERHGWGANMRIVTNMHITDPALDVDKTAYQYGQEIEYGGVIDPTASLEYNFSLTNSGNTKLYNLTFEDEVIGVTLDPTNGLTVAMHTDTISKNGVYVRDSLGSTLEAKDLTATVQGYNARGEYVEVNVTFPEVDGDGGQTALKNFLKTLNAEGTESGYDDAEVTHAGSGLWVDSTVIIKGIHYMLTPDQIEAGTVHNTVYLTATTRVDPNAIGSKTLYSDADHRIYTSGFPVHYQWAGHNIFMKMNHLIESAKKEATVENSQLSLYAQFFGKITDSDDIYYNICDKYGRTGGVYPYHTKTTILEEAGYLINYDEPGIYTFYLLMYLQKGESKSYAPTGVDAEDIAEGEYAIIRSQVYVADVEDSVYVLDYGLSTESLDLDGELFKNDYLFGPYGTIRAKLMGVTGTQPSYIDPETATTTDYSRIDFSAQDLTDKNTIETPDGIFKVNLAIPADGKLIGYDSTTGDYTLTGVGTVTINATVPTDGNWNTPYLYYWYDDGVSGPAWPGTAMTSMEASGQYKIDIPADVTNIIINNGSGALQTEDLKITPGLESTVHVSVTDGVVSASIETILESVTLHAKVPSTWEKVYVHYWYDNDATAGTTFPGEEVDVVDDAYYVDANGYFTYELPGDVTNVIISDGANAQSGNQTIYAGREVWIEVADTLADSVENEDGSVTNYHNTVVKYTLSDGYVFHASVPASWKDTVYLYYWHAGMTDDEMKWPGIELTKGEFGWYTLDGLVPAEITQIVINDDVDGTMGDGDHQTVDLTVTPGLETWVMVNNETGSDGKYTATVAYGSESGSTGLTFTPKKFMDEANEMWLALTVHSTSFSPTKINTGIDIHNEVQMYKKITIVPATVVYYEDSFEDINYNEDDTTSENTFIHHGNGSGRLSQSVNQEQPYGQDATYQDSSNELYSGNSMLAVKIMDTANVATFTFKGTGFELISRTNAIDSASIVARVYKSENYYKGVYDQYVEDLTAYNEDPTGKEEPVNPTEKILPVITQFDHGNDGGNEAINQVPTVRITGLEYDEYTVELYGMPTYTFDPDNNYAITGTKDTYLYIDGLRIYQPMGATHDAYTDAENGAEVVEIRDLIMNGQIAVGALEDGLLKLSTGTVTWTENLTDNDFDPAKSETYEGIKVDSTDDYLIQGPNNEVYMEGNASNSAVVFYVSEDTASETHELQIAVRALDYGKFYGSGSSALNAQLQYGVLRSDGTYAWKNLVRVVSGTEQYYSIPYAECPVDSQGRYQIVVRAVNPQTNSLAMVSYTSVKLNGLNIEKVEGVGESTILYYLNGVLVKPQYELVIIDDQFQEVEVIPFTGNELTMTLEQDLTYVYIRSTLNGTVSNYFGKSDPGAATSATMYKYDDSFTRYTLDIPKGSGNGEVTLKIKQTNTDSLELSYCLHTWGEGVVTKEPNCTETGVMSYTCTACGHVKHEDIPTNGKHTYSGAKCIRCGADEPKYYLIGNINGADYGCNNDYQNMGEYLFVDGKLVVTFTKDSYVFVKADNNAAWYMSKAYITEKTGTFYDTATNTDAAEKMYVPCDLELTFTLVVNDDGTLTLSYALPCTHEWNAGEITTKPTCTEAGVRTYTCSLCGKTKTESVEANGHSYENGTCTVCGDVKMITVYFKNTAGWTDVYVWAWNSSENFTGGVWPGVAMTPVEGEDGIYSFTLPATATGIIFNNGSDTQTSDLTIPTDGRNLYSFDTGLWTVKGEVLEYYLVGYINGADYGCNDDQDTQSIYKFVDGKLEATFESDSYVFVKTTNNANWYMTEGYPGDDVYSATLYNTNSGLTDANKLRAPGGTKLTFVLVDNGDDTFQLTVHAWGDGLATTPATCTTNGVRTYTCSLCLDSYTEVIPATGHTFVDGVCACGELEQQIVYFRNSDGWTNVYIYAFTEGSPATEYSGSWPGTLMSLVDGETDLYYYYVPVNAQSVIFNAGVDMPQTDNLTVPTDGRNKYTYGANVWTTLDEEPEIPEAPEAQTLYLLPNSNWIADSARFAAYFFNDSGNTWVDMTDTDGDGYYECVVPDGYTTVIFCRMNGSSTENNWDNKWNQTGNLAVPTDDTNLCTINDGEWDCGENVTWSTYTPASAASVLMVANSMEVANAAAYAEETAIELPEIYIEGDEETALNLFAISQQMNSDVVIGEMDILDEDDVVSGGESEPETDCVTGHDWSYTCSDAAHTFTCAACGKTVEVENTDGKKFGFKSAAPVLTDDINMRYGVEVPAGFTNAYMVFSFNGTETVVTDYTVNENGRYLFVFEGVTPQKIGDNISATLCATVGGEQVSISLDQYSVRQYCINMLASESITDTLRTLLSDLLVYGAKAQVYQGYKTDALVTEGVELTPSTFTDLDESFNKQQLAGLSDPNVKYTGVTLALYGKMTLRLAVATADPDAYTYKVTINNETTVYTGEDLVKAGDGKYYLYFDNLKATAFDDVITAKIEQDSVQVGKTVSYSVNTYIYKNQNSSDTELRELLEAIYNYGASAKAYLAEQ